MLALAKRKQGETWDPMELGSGTCSTEGPVQSQQCNLQCQKGEPCHGSWGYEHLEGIPASNVGIEGISYLLRGGVRTKTPQGVGSMPNELRWYYAKLQSQQWTGIQSRKLRMKSAEKIGLQPAVQGSSDNRPTAARQIPDSFAGGNPCSPQSDWLSA